MWAYPRYLKRHFKEGLRRREPNVEGILLDSVRKSSWKVTREIGHYPPRESSAIHEHEVIVGSFEV